MRSIVIASLLLASAVQAAEVGPCGDLDRIGNLVGQTRPFSENKIRVAHVDTDGEPVCCSEHLLVFIPASPMGSQCFAVSQRAARGDSSALGFNSVAFARIKASYDPKRGLLLNVPYTLYNEGNAGKPAQANVRINLTGEGSVVVER